MYKTSLSCHYITQMHCPCKASQWALFFDLGDKHPSRSGNVAKDSSVPFLPNFTRDKQHQRDKAAYTTEFSQKHFCSTTPQRNQHLPSQWAEHPVGQASSWSCRKLWLCTGTEIEDEPRTQTTNNNLITVDKVHISSISKRKKNIVIRPNNPHLRGPCLIYRWAKSTLCLLL